MIPEDFKKPTPTGIEEIEIQELEPVKDGVKIEVWDKLYIRGFFEYLSYYL